MILGELLTNCTHNVLEEENKLNEANGDITTVIEPPI